MKRTLGELLAAAMATGLLRHGLPLAGDDPFRTTLIILPLAVAALRAIERQLGRRVRPSAAPFEAVVLATLLLLTLGRRSFGLAATDWFLAAGWLLLLAHRVARIVLGLRPGLGSRLPRRPSVAFALLPLVVYLSIQPWMAEHRQPDGDEPFYLLLTHSLAHDLDADLANNYTGEHWHSFMERTIEPQLGDPRGPEGQVYSRHDVLLPAVLVPAYLAGGRWGVMMTMAAAAAALAWMVLRLAWRYFPDRPGAALLAYALFAFCPPVLVYSYQVWIEIPAALLLCLGLDRVGSSAATGWRRRDAAVFAGVLIALPLLKLRLGLVALPLLVLALLRSRPSKRLAGCFLGAFGAALASLLLYNYLRLGHLLRTHGWNELWTDGGVTAYLRGAVGLFYDSAFGLFPHAPIWALLVPACGWLWRRRERLLKDLLVVAVPYFVMLTPRAEWYGGWSPAFRYGLIFLPLLALALVPLLEERRRPGLRAVLAALLTLTVVLTLVWVVIPGWTYNFADGRTHLLDAAGTRIGADVARFFPSTVRLRPATWVWPAVSLLLIPIAAWRGRRRPATGLPAGVTPGMAGLVALLLLLAVLPVAARHWPTRIIELEDAYVVKVGGMIFPKLWIPHRTRFRSGWHLTPPGRLTAPVVPGGRRVVLRLHARVASDRESARLFVDAGDLPLAAWEVRAGDWRDTDLGPFDWPPGAPLVIRGAGKGAPGAGVVALDRAELTWQ